MNGETRERDQGDALIGYSGFVGTALRTQRGFAHCYNSQNISDSAGKRFDTVVCAAAPGSMLEANKLPARDVARIKQLMEALSDIVAQRFVLISTVAVFDGFCSPRAEDSANFQQAAGYGRNRRMLEEFCCNRFRSCLIVRLPALFGHGLRKNFLFDILNPIPSFLTAARLQHISESLPTALSRHLRALYVHNDLLSLYELRREQANISPARRELELALTDRRLSALEFTNSDSTFQFYDMARLWADTARAIAAELDVVHLAPEPVRAGEVFHAATGAEILHNDARIHHENLTTLHAPLFGGSPPYIQDTSQVLAAVTTFLATPLRSQ